MNRTIRTALGSLALAGAVGAAAFVPSRTASAQTAEVTHPHHGHGHRDGLLGAALRLDTLTPAQRSAIEAIAQQQRAARAPVRQADAQVLEALAHQVEQANIDPQGLAPALNIEKNAVSTEVGVERDSLNRLHAILTPAQRGQLVDAIAAHSGGHHLHGDAGAHGPGPEGWGRAGHGLGLTEQQRAQIRANLQAEMPAGQPGHARGMLEAFRGDTFDATSFVAGVAPGERAERLAQAMVPVLSPGQRNAFASHLRARAAHESRS